MRSGIWTTIGTFCLALTAFGVGHAQTQTTTITRMQLANPVKVSLVGQPQATATNTRFTVKAVISNASNQLIPAVKRAISVRTNNTRQYWLSSSSPKIDGNEVVIDNRIRLEYWQSRKVLSKTSYRKLREEVRDVSYRLSPGIARGTLAIVSTNHRSAPTNVIQRQVVWTPPGGMLDQKIFQSLSPKIVGVGRPQLRSGAVTFTISMEVAGRHNATLLTKMLQ